MKPPRITLHIGRLVLHDFPRLDPTSVGNGLQTELRRLLERGSLAGTPAHSARVDAGTIAARADSSPELIGVQLARRIAVQLGVTETESGTGRSVPGGRGRGGGQ